MFVWYIKRLSDFLTMSIVRDVPEREGLVCIRWARFHVLDSPLSISGQDASIFNPAFRDDEADVWRKWIE